MQNRLNVFGINFWGLNVWLLLSCMIVSVSCHARDVDMSKLKVPAGFHIDIFTDTGGKPRMLVFSPGGVLLATLMNEGDVVAYPDPKHTGHPERAVKVLTDLNAPHGMAFYHGKFYVAETNRVVAYDWDEVNLRATNPHPIADLPRSGMHFTRTLLFVGDKLYVSVGSDCNICDEPDNRRAAVLEMNPDGSGQRVFGRGIRNAVGLALNQKTGTVWTSDNGRDWLGDDLPPDQINDLGKTGGDFGWPYCYGQRTIDSHAGVRGEDAQRLTPGEGTKRCPETIPSKVNLQAHSAPLGMAFDYGNNFPKDYRGDLFVALHGSWNRSVPTGYKIIRIKLKNGVEPEKTEDFVTGWLAPGETKRGAWMGRPVDVVFGPDGAMYISDDFSGPIYRVTYGK